MDIEETLKKEFKQLGDCNKTLCFCIAAMEAEELNDNDPETIGAWKTLIHKHLNKFKTTLEQHKANVAHSWLDERMDEFEITMSKLPDKLEAYKGYEDETWRRSIGQTQLLIEEGAAGFRQGFITDTYHEELLCEERERYRQENHIRLEKIYQQDLADEVYTHPDETERKNLMVSHCRKKFHETTFGKVYHDQGRDKKKISAYIIDQKEQDYKNINEFLGKWLALEIAEEHCHEKHEQVYKNVIFKDNVDIDKVMERLAVYIKDKVLKSQKHWFVVFIVFKKKNWLRKDTQISFRDQMNAAFGTVLKCTVSDFKKVSSYFKKTDYTDWSLEDRTAPSCCEEYKKIALMLDEEFQDTKYAKPGTTITTRKIEKLG